MKETLAIDFDGVIHDYKKISSGYKLGVPIAGAKEALTLLSEKYNVIVFTAWKTTDLPQVERWLKYFKIPYDEVTNVKPLAKYYIDDRAIKFVNWEDTLKEII